MRDWLSRKDWNAEKKYWREYEAQQRAKGGASLVTDEELASLPAESLRQLVHNHWMSLRFIGRAPEVGLYVVGDVASKQHHIKIIEEQTK